MGCQAIIIILWIILSTLAILDYLPQAKELKGINLILFFIIFIIGGPTFALNQILTTILELILPEGWNEDDFNKGC